MSQRPLRLLLVEDSEADATLLAEMLEDTAQVKWVRSLDAGVRALNEGRFDAILLDLSLPDSHGVESVATMHLFDTETPIVVLTSLDDDAAAFEALRQGAQDYLVKGTMDGRGLLRTVRFAKQRVDMQQHLATQPQGDDSREPVVRAVGCPTGPDMVPALARHVQGLASDQVLYVTFDQPAAVLQRRLKRAGVTGLHFIDVSGQAEQEQGRIYVPDDPRDLEVVALEVERACAALGPASHVIVDSINSLILHHGVDAAAVFCHGLANRLRVLRIDADFVGHRNQEWPYIVDRFSFLDEEALLEAAASEAGPDPSIA